jgi:hypothetical protein
VQPTRAGGKAVDTAVDGVRQLGDVDVLEVCAGGGHGCLLERLADAFA